MSKIELDSNLINKIYQFLTKLKVVKYSTMIGVIIYSGAICVGSIVAFVYGGTLQGPGTYSIFTNYISDMGSFNYTPMPFILDFGCMLTSFFLIPSLFYLKKRLNPLPQNEEDLKDKSSKKLGLGKILCNIGFIFMIIGLIGMFGVGLFSEDRTTSLDLHWIFTIVVFNGFAFTSFFYGLVICFYSEKIPKILGLYMFITPIVMIIILFGFGFQPFHEWLTFFVLLGWMIPLSIIFLKEINEELRRT
ncbi:MAG: hypothetical protein ACFFCM_04250 [Promethearchaeota archaeon]